MNRSAARMFALVHHIEDYPKHFSWCTASEVLETSDDTLTGRLDLSLNGIPFTLTTRNTFASPRSIHLALIDGPLRDLTGEWRFIVLGNSACRVELDLEFSFAGSLVGSALAIGFGSFVDRLVEDFVRTAKKPT